jgi:hypothetical protein
MRIFCPLLAKTVIHKSMACEQPFVRRISPNLYIRLSGREQYFATAVLADSLPYEGVYL